MRLNILIGGKAGQGINKISEIVSHILVKNGYFIFNYRDYPSLIRGGHNFNVLSISDERNGSIDSEVDCIIAMDDKTVEIHKKELKKSGFIIDRRGFEDLGRNLNVALAGVLIKILGISKEDLIEEVKSTLNYPESISAAERGYEKGKSRFNLKKLEKKISIMTGSRAVALGAINSKMHLYIGYPMTPATGTLHELAGLQEKYGHLVFQPENEIAAVNIALGSSFAGAKTMTGSSGGGFDLMTEGLSMQGISEVPLVVYLASRPGPGTGVPTYSTQSDLDIALRGGHGEFPRVVITPGDPIECVEKTNEAFYLSEKYGCLSVLLSDKHLAESEFSSDRRPNKTLKVEIKRAVPGKGIVKANSYEHDSFGNTTESGLISKKNSEDRMKKYLKIKRECEKFEMIKMYGDSDAKNLIICWGSTKTVVLDAVDAIDGSIKNGKGDYKVLQVLYMKPLSNKIKDEIEKSRKAGGKVILIENNLTGQLGRLIREKTGIKIENRILKYDTRPIKCNLLKEEILKI
jgi:2-oxoglutarate/2-oxoacid ferredoxin oxidoreductase subunit alpha